MYIYIYVFKEYTCIILYYIIRKFRRHFLVWKLDVIQYRKFKRKSRWKYLNLCDLLCTFYYYVMQINCIRIFRTVRCDGSLRFRVYSRTLNISTLYYIHIIHKYNMYVQVADPLVYLSVVGNYTYTILIRVKARISKCIIYAALLSIWKNVKTTYNG